MSALSDRRAGALLVLLEVAALLPDDLDVSLMVESFDQAVSMLLGTSDPAVGTALANTLHLKAAAPASTAQSVHYTWRGQRRGHLIRISVLVPVDRVHAEYRAYLCMMSDHGCDCVALDFDEWTTLAVSS